MMSASLTASQQVQRILRERAEMERLAIGKPGPHVYGIYAHGLQRIWPRS